MPQRLALLEDWLHRLPGLAGSRIEPASDDASFRRYFRVSTKGGTFIAMDSPPDKEAVEPFMRIAEQMRSVGLHVPEVLAHDTERGFLLVSDLGSRLYLEALNADTVERLYGDALSALAVIQACAPTQGLPSYDAALLRRELELFPQWLLERRLGLNLSPEERSALEQVFRLLIDAALEQPRVFVHRDYHSRNLMVTASPSPGILDFQGAVLGPVTYDLVSLLRDCYVRWPRDKVQDWAWGYFELAVQSGILRAEHEGDFQRWFDLMGVQRQLKASGIFTRLYLRDGKPGYLEDIPRTLGYVLEVAPSYPSLAPLADLIAQRVMPRL